MSKNTEGTQQETHKKTQRKWLQPRKLSNLCVDYIILAIEVRTPPERKEKKQLRMWGDPGDCPKWSVPESPSGKSGTVSSEVLAEGNLPCCDCVDTTRKSLVNSSAHAGLSWPKLSCTTVLTVAWPLGMAALCSPSKDLSLLDQLQHHLLNTKVR